MNIEVYILPAGIVQLNTIYIKVYLLTASQDVTFGDEDVVFYGLPSQVLIMSYYRINLLRNLSLRR